MDAELPFREYRRLWRGGSDVILECLEVISWPLDAVILLALPAAGGGGRG